MTAERLQSIARARGLKFICVCGRGYRYPPDFYNFIKKHRAKVFQ